MTPEAGVTLIDGTRRLPPAAAQWIVGRLKAALRHLSVAGECRVRIAGDIEVAEAHARHLGVPGTTDVITFDLSERRPEGGPGTLDVDLLVCLDEAERQAGAAGRPVESELLLYMIHGVLHCLGHDDHDETAAALMHQREDEILTAIGVGPVFGAGAGPGGGA